MAPAPGLASGLDLRPSMSWKSAVSLVKRVPAGEAISYGLRYRLERAAWVATVPVGYADGYRRELSRDGPCPDPRAAAPGGRDGHDGPAHGRLRRPASGVGEEVVLFGRQGEEEITADELASWLGTINYEVVCGLSERVPREYVG